VIDSSAASSPTAGAGSNGTASASAGATAAGSAAKGSDGRVTFEVPPGQMSLKLSVEGGAGQVLDSDFRDLVIPDYNKPDAPLSPSRPSIAPARSAPCRRCSAIRTRSPRRRASSAGRNG